MLNNTYEDLNGSVIKKMAETNAVYTSKIQH